MPPRYCLRLLGAPELRGPDGEAVRFRVRKHFALLAYLGSERRQVHRRDRLADLLWPDASAAEGRHSVATALSAIRGKLGPRSFECTRDTVRFVGANLEVDLERLASGDVLGDDIRPPLEVAGLLEEFEISRAPEYMHWRDQLRAKWLPQVQGALILLMDRCRRTGDFARIEGHADRMLSLDEYSEHAIRAKMEARAFAGDRLTAIRIYQAWRQRLEEELGAAPSGMVEGVALRLRQRGGEPAGTSHVPTVHTEQWRNRPFIGRGPQYRVVYEAWERARAGAARHALVLGDSGIGKSTLVERLTTAAGLEGAVTTRVQCYEVEREIPYAAVGTLARGLLDHPGASGTPAEWLGELARVVSAVRERFPQVPVTTPMDGETARMRLAEGLHQLAMAVAEEHPVILVVDDVHITDDVSVAVLHLLMRRTQSQRIMVIMTARQAELARSPHASRLIESRRPLGLEVVEVPPFTPEEMHDLVTALAATAGVTVPPAVRRALLQASAGIPMVAELLFDDWRAHGDRCLALSVGAMTADLAGHDDREVYRQIFDRVFAGLSREAQVVLNLAAILGERLNDTGMYQLVNLTTAQQLSGMYELTQLRLLVDSGKEVRFRNELIRNYAYVSVPSPLRKTLHGLIVDRLVELREGGGDIPSLMLAWHFFRSGQTALAIPQLMVGAREAIDKGAPHEAELALSSATASLDHQQRAEATLLVAEALQEQGEWQRSYDHLRDSLPASPVAEGRFNVLRLLAQANMRRDAESTRACFEEAQATLSTSLDTWVLARALETASTLAASLADPIAAERAFLPAQRLLDSIEALSERTIISQAYARLCFTVGRIDLLPKRIRELRELAQENERRGALTSHLARSYNVQGCAEACLGDYRDALSSFFSAYALHEQHGNDDRAAGVALNIALCHGRLGAYREEETWAEKAIQLSPKGQNPWRWIKGACRVAWSLAMRGENRRAIRQFEDRVDLQMYLPLRWEGQALALIYSDLLWISGNEGRAVSVARDAIHEFGRHPLSQGYAGPFARWLARVGPEIYEVQVVRDLIENMRSAAGRYERIDQAEILVAQQLIEEKESAEWGATGARLQRLLAELPEPVGAQLRRLGF